MGIFGNGKEIKKLQAQLASIQRLNTISTFGNAVAVYPKWDVKSIANRYCDTDDVYSVVRKLATTSALIPMYPYYEKDKAAAKQLKHFSPTGKPYQQKQLQLKALEDLPETDPVYELLENPSDLLSKYEFYEAAYSMLYLHGRCVIYKERGEVRNNPRKLHVWFPQFVVMNVTRTYPQVIESYDYVIDGFTVMKGVPPEDIIDIKYFNPHYSISGTELGGLSPIRVLANRLTRMDEEMNASVAQLQNGGVPGIVYDKSDDGSAIKDEAGNELTITGRRKDNFFKYLSNTSNKGAPYFSAGELGYIQLGLKLADMDVAALDKIDFKKLCNAYSISDRLFNNDATGSEISDNNARKGLYTDACLPNVFRFAAALEKGLENDFDDKRKRIIHADITGIPELQDDMKELAEWLSTAWWIDPNEKRDMMKWDRSDNPLFNNFIVPTGLQIIDDLTAVDDLPNPMNDYNQNQDG